ncbi:MAG: hypothetical protein ACT4PO_02630 [Actinomycetota bacterium]
MAIASHASGTTAALTIGTELFLGTDPDATDGVFQFVVAVNNLALADKLEIRVYEAPLAADVTSEQVQMWPLNHNQVDDLWMSPGVILLNRWRFSLKQTAGTGRTFRWEIRKLT